MALSASSLNAQTGSVAGRVTDARTGASVPAAQVTIVGTSLGAIADADGRFRIEGVPEGTRIARAIRIGYQSAA
ncbi:MAG TPA: carboxypeptidase regulatory-like domain-containing protein, partial [Longimicrobiales bacterium]|nr:carboxypeptidase regulatory-like domain-containing protein [Longimicrobiales bacterium]